mgnify:CR=1 FL=1|jgi:Cu(I)-responsive transcriptional regulator
MNIGEAASRCGLPVKTVRYYDDIKLIIPARTDSGYREYNSFDVHRLRFVARARGLGFSIEDCRHLLSLYDDSERASSDVKAIVRQKLREIDLKVEELQSIRKTLQHLSRHCRGDNRPECPILDDLAGMGRG